MVLSISAQVAPDGATRLAVTGEVDLGTVQSLRNAITEAIETDHAADLVVDLDSVKFLDSTGIAALVEGRRLADECSTGYRVVNPRGMIRRVLEITGVLDYLTGDPAGDRSAHP